MILYHNRSSEVEGIRGGIRFEMSATKSDAKNGPATTTVDQPKGSISTTTLQVNGVEKVRRVSESEEILEYVEDPYCSETKPQKINFHDVTSAAFMIRGGVNLTPCPRSHLCEMTGMDVYLKKEFEQFTGRSIDFE